MPACAKGDEKTCATDVIDAVFFCITMYLVDAIYWSKLVIANGHRLYVGSAMPMSKAPSVNVFPLDTP